MLVICATINDNLSTLDNLPRNLRTYFNLFQPIIIHFPDELTIMLLSVPHPPGAAILVVGGLDKVILAIG
jgi:hypothetical protein